MREERVGEGVDAVLRRTCERAADRSAPSLAASTGRRERRGKTHVKQLEGVVADGLLLLGLGLLGLLAGLAGLLGLLLLRVVQAKLEQEALDEPGERVVREELGERFEVGERVLVCGGSAHNRTISEGA